MENYNNFNSVCRLCLSDDNESCTSIFDDNHRFLAQMISSCVNIEIQETDKMTTLICIRCVNKIEDLHNFKRTCQEAQITLDSWINTLFGEKAHDLSFQVKEEISEGNDVFDFSSDIIEVKPEPESDYEDMDLFHSLEMQTESNEENDLAAPTLSPIRPVLNHSDSNESLLMPTDLPAYEDEDVFNGVYKKNNAGKVSLSCTTCSKTFSNAANRIRHERTVHEQADTEEEYRYMPLLNGDVTKKQFAASLQLVENGPSKKSLSEKEFIDYNKKMQKILVSRVCTCCGIEFTNRKALIGHLKKKGNIDPLACFQCGISFPDYAQYVKHRSSLCRKRAKLLLRKTERIKFYEHFKCGQCNHLFVLATSYCSHLLKKHQPKRLPFNCFTCGQQLNTHEEFTSHCFSSCGLKTYCSICGTTYNTKEEFLSHSIIHSNSGSSLSPNKVFYCQFCPLLQSTTFSTKRDLDVHLSTMHQTILKQLTFSCNVCGYLSETFDDWKLHQTTHKETENGNLKMKLVRCSDSNSYTFSPLTCDVCDKVFATNRELQQHTRLHMEMPVLESIHEKKDNKLKPTYHCEVCSKTFYVYSSLYRHRKSKHGIKGPSVAPTAPPRNKRQCPICMQYVSNPKAMWYHKKKYHSNPNALKIKKEKSMPVLLPVDDELTSAGRKMRKARKKDYSCTECDKVFNHPTGLSNHLRGGKHITPPTLERMRPHKQQQLKEKVYSCRICYKTFGTPGAKNKHMVVHLKKDTAELPSVNSKSNSKNLQCHVCRRYIVNAAGMSSHLRTHQRTGVSDHSCNKCGENFLTFEGLEKHSKIHLVPKKSFKEIDNSLRCEECPKIFTALQSLQSHKGWHKRKSRLAAKRLKKKNITTISCKTCKLNFDTYEALIQHKSTHEDPYCHLCKKRFTYLGYYRNHMRNIHNLDTTNETNHSEVPQPVRHGYSCTECTISFDNATSLRNHISSHLF